MAKKKKTAAKPKTQDAAIGDLAARYGPGEPKAAPRATMVVFGGVFVSLAHARRPRILRLEPSRPRGGAEIRGRKP